MKIKYRYVTFGAGLIVCIFLTFSLPVFIEWLGLIDPNSEASQLQLKQDLGMMYLVVLPTLYYIGRAVEDD